MTLNYILRDWDIDSPILCITYACRNLHVRYRDDFLNSSTPDLPVDNRARKESSRLSRGLKFQLNVFFRRYGGYCMFVHKLLHVIFQ